MKPSLLVVLALSTFGIIACEQNVEPVPSKTAVTANATATVTADAVVDAGSGCGPKGATYVACGCGCCGEPSTDRVRCVDTSKGETLASIKASDQARKASKLCMSVGCSLGTVYKCCD